MSDASNSAERESEAQLSEALSEAIARYPELSGARVTQISRGLIHQTWRVEAGDRGYILQKLNPIFSLAVHENIEAVTTRLAERGVETPRLCRTREGALFADVLRSGVAGAHFRLMTLVPGETFDTCPSAAHAASAGELVGRFHSALHDLDHAFAPLGFPFHDTDRYFRELHRAIDSHRDHAMHADVVSLAGLLDAIRADWAPIDDVPDRVVHLDLKFNNILFAGDRAHCLIDLDTLSRGPLWVELGDAWRSWCNRRPEHEPVAELDTEIFEASAAAWMDHVEFALGEPEIASLAHGLERITTELAVRFAADVLEDSYFGWNPDLFGSRADHNLSRVRGQLSLHDQAKETRADRLKFLRDRAT